MDHYTIFIFSFPFIMNLIGAGLIYFIPKIKDNGLFLGVAAGVMSAACIWSLIIPSIELSSSLGRFSFFPVSVGLILGAVIIHFADYLVKKGFSHGGFNKLFWGMTLHNVAEGFAVGFSAGVGGANIFNALSVSFAIGVQNLPEGLAIALVYKREGCGNGKSFYYGTLSGAVEPISALIGALLVAYLRFLQPIILAFSAGAMIYVIIKELIPESVNEKWGIWGFTAGFCIMMALDLAFG